MSGAPRDWLLDPSVFGRARSVEWVMSESPRDVASLAAARLQHESAIYVRMFLRAEERTQGWLAAALNWRRERLSRLLGGQVWAGLADLEQVLRACRSSVAGVSWLSAHVDDRATPARQIVASYLRDQLEQLDPTAASPRPR